MHALQGIDLQIPRGSVFGLLGPNGAGKTTLVKILLGIAFPSGGSASVLGKPPGDVSALARIGYLPENHRYPAHLTGEQVLHHFGRLSGIRQPERGRRVTEMLRRVRLEEWRGTRTHKYSKGMMQRLGMAQAVLNEPDLLILDEPTDGVDPIGRHELRDLVLEQQRRGATIFLNSHLLSEVERLCDRVAILKQGRLVRHGTLDDLTRGTEGHEVIVRGLGPDRLDKLIVENPGLKAVEERSGGEDRRLRLAGDLDALNRLIDRLRVAGASIVSVLPARDSLEDVFVKVVGEEDS
ncbi:MAG: ABC transporter ATP-binding protein [Acidobacteria bacterium]|nr:ABC transporter ATP-binding protein [Acidobacteriota bacterium]